MSTTGRALGDDDLTGNKSQKPRFSNSHSRATIKAASKHTLGYFEININQTLTRVSVRERDDSVHFSSAQDRSDEFTVNHTLNTAQYANSPLTSRPPSRKKVAFSPTNTEW